jgi:hypothetical protein
VFLRVTVRGPGSGHIGQGYILRGTKNARDVSSKKKKRWELFGLGHIVMASLDPYGMAVSLVPFISRLVYSWLRVQKGRLGGQGKRKYSTTLVDKAPKTILKNRPLLARPSVWFAK